MNIVTPYPSNIPINTVNVTTELARRDNQLREVIAKPAANQAGAAERGVASEQDKARPGQQNPNNFDGELRNAQNEHKIQERGQHQHGQEQQEQQKEQSSKQAEAAKKQVEQTETLELRELKSRDSEVRTHEQAHAAVGGRFAGSPTYSFKRGPDGNNYAVGGEVSISTSPVAGDPAATISKMQQVRAAALAPAEPSGQDRKVAAEAIQGITQARTDQIKQAAEEREVQAQERAAEAEESAPADEQNVDPFNLLGEADENAIGLNPASNPAINAATNRNANAFAEVFGLGDSDGDAQDENRSVGNFSVPEEDNRSGAVLARASRVQSFYQAATRPHETGFSQFA